MTDDGLPEAAPGFRNHFSDPLYDDPNSEFAPFGTDEGYDLLLEWADRRDELSQATTLAELLAAGDYEPEKDSEQAGVDDASIVVGAGFTLLRLTGTIDEEGRRHTLAALEALIQYYDSPRELLVQRRDLQNWRR